MKTNRLSIAAILMTICASAGAQTSYDAAKLYEEDLNGTSRYIGMGGAMGALGSDLSVISSNPAGIGTYRNCDFTGALSFFGTETSTKPKTSQSSPLTLYGRTYYSGDNMSDINCAFENLGIVLSGNDGSDNYMNFAFAYRKLQKLDRTLDYYDSFLDADGNEVWRDYINMENGVKNAFDINISYNLSDLVYLGWTFEMLGTRSESNASFSDYYEAGNHPAYTGRYYITGADWLTSSKGSGFNMSFGMIVRPVSPLRLGIAIKTPTRYSQELRYEDWDGMFEEQTLEDSNKSTNYVFRSPWSLDLSAGLTYAKSALGVEYERHFTQRSSLSVDNIRMMGQGAMDYKDYSVFKIGFEQNIKNLSFRAGYNYRGSIYNDNEVPYLYDSSFNGWQLDENGKVCEAGRFDYQTDRSESTRNCTFGIGYCSEPDYDGTQFYVDLAYVYGRRYSNLRLNELDEDISAKYLTRTHKFQITMGWNF